MADPGTDRRWFFAVLAQEIADAPAGPVPLPSVGLRPEVGGTISLLRKLEKQIFGSRPGLPRGERALAALVAARRIGCRSCAAAYASIAVRHLRRDREVLVVLEEGVPSPLKGRRGAVVQGAAAVTATPHLPDLEPLRRLDAEGFDERDHVDLILATAVAVWASRVALGSGVAQGPLG